MVTGETNYDYDYLRLTKPTLAPLIKTVLAFVFSSFLISGPDFGNVPELLVVGLSRSFLCTPSLVRGRVTTLLRKKLREKNTSFKLSVMIRIYSGSKVDLIPQKSRYEAQFASTTNRN